jgi:hypothetical protein
MRRFRAIACMSGLVFQGYTEQQKSARMNASRVTVTRPSKPTPFAFSLTEASRREIE